MKETDEEIQKLLDMKVLEESEHKKEEVIYQNFWYKSLSVYTEWSWTNLLFISCIYLSQIWTLSSISVLWVWQIGRSFICFKNKNKSEPLIVKLNCLMRDESSTLTWIKQFNEGVEYGHFKMENLNSATDFMRQKCYMASVNLSHAYCSVSIYSDFRKFLKLFWRGQLHATHASPTDCPAVLATLRNRWSQYMLIWEHKVFFHPPS